MTFLKLYEKLGKHPIRNTRTNEIVAAFDKESLLSVVSKTDEAIVNIPLMLKIEKDKIYFTQKLK